jgi:hypothetical protein
VKRGFSQTITCCKAIELRARGYERQHVPDLIEEAVGERDK